MPTQTIAFRPTEQQQQIIDRWIASHQEQEGGRLTTSDALRAALDALGQMEARRARDRERSVRYRAAQAKWREITARNGSRSGATGK